jgi:hypothetical protein
MRLSPDTNHQNVPMAGVEPTSPKRQRGSSRSSRPTGLMEVGTSTGDLKHVTSMQIPSTGSTS